MYKILEHELYHILAAGLYLAGKDVDVADALAMIRIDSKTKEGEARVHIDGQDRQFNLEMGGAMALGPIALAGSNTFRKTLIDGNWDGSQELSPVDKSLVEKHCALNVQQKRQLLLGVRFYAASLGQRKIAASLTVIRKLASHEMAVPLDHFVKQELAENCLVRSYRNQHNLMLGQEWDQRLKGEVYEADQRRNRSQIRLFKAMERAG